MRGSDVSLASHNFGSLHCVHLLSPTRGGDQFADGADLVRSIAWDADVVVALQNELDVADVEGRRFAQLAELARGADDGVDEVVCELENGLDIVSKGQVKASDR